MKIFNKFTYALMALSLFAVSCVQEETFKPGEEEDANCYGVYFPTQEASGFHEVDPALAAEVVVKVSRKVSTDAISVPIDVVTTDSIWVCPKTIEFEAGMSDTTIVISFDAALTGVKYDGITIEINDPKYASKYSSNATYFNYSVQKVKWNPIGEAVWYDSIIGGVMSVPYNPELTVEVQERNDIPGIFRFKNVYGADYPFNDPGDYEESDFWVTIDASDSSKVDVPYQYMGLTWSYGPFYMGSTYQFYKMYKGYTDEEMESNLPSVCALLGTYDKINNVITFPDGGMGVALPGYADPATGYWWDANDEFYVIMPGGKLVDYSLSMEAYETEDVEGENCAPIVITTGPDVDTVKYTVLQGVLTQSQYDDEASAIIRGAAENIKSVKTDPSCETIIYYSDTTTATYTLIAVAYNAKGEAQGYDRIEFGYVAKGDEVPVVAGFNASSIAGITQDNEILFTLIGKDIVEARVTVADYASMIASQEAYNDAVAEVYTATALDADALKAVNANGYSAKYDGLLPGTEYVAIAYVFNGFQSNILMSKVKTSGLPKKIYRSWDEPDSTIMANVTKAEDYYGTYNYYAKRYGTYASGKKYNDVLRSYVGKVKIEDSGIPKDGPDKDGLYDEYVMVTGLFSPFVEYTGITDTLIFDVYDGIMYNLVQSMGVAYGSYYAAFVPYLTKYGCQASFNYAYNGAFAEDGYISFFNSTQYELSAFAVGAYSTYTQEDGFGDIAGCVCIMSDPLLVDPALDENGVDPTSAAKASSNAAGSERLFDLSTNHVRLNYVETTKGYAKSQIDKAKAARMAAKKVSKITTVEGVSAPAAKANGQIKVVSTPKVTNAPASLDKTALAISKVRR